MLELAATAWVYALAITMSLFVGVLVVQGVVRHVRSTTRVVRRAADVAVEASSGPELVSAGSRAA